MPNKSKLLAITAIAAIVSTSSAFASDRGDLVRVRDTVNYSQKHVMRHAAGAKAQQEIQPLTPAERLEPFTAEQKRALDAPDPFYHPDMF